MYQTDLNLESYGHEHDQEIYRASTDQNWYLPNLLISATSVLKSSKKWLANWK